MVMPCLRSAESRQKQAQIELRASRSWPCARVGGERRQDLAKITSLDS